MSQVRFAWPVRIICTHKTQQRPRPHTYSLFLISQACRSPLPAKIPKTEKLNLHVFELHRPSSKGTKFLFHVINATINQYNVRSLWQIQNKVSQVYSAKEPDIHFGCLRSCGQPTNTLPNCSVMSRASSLPDCQDGSTGMPAKTRGKRTLWSSHRRSKGLLWGWRVFSKLIY